MKELYSLLYFHKGSRIEKDINQLYLSREVEIWVNEGTFIPENLNLPSLEVLWIHMQEKNHITIPEDVSFPKLEAIEVLPDEEGYYSIKTPHRFDKITSIITND